MSRFRMPARIGIEVLIAFILLIGCRHANSQVELTIIENGAFSGRRDTRYDFKVISDQQALAEHYRKAHAHKLEQPAAPQIDFKHQLVLVAFMGQQSTAGYGIQFDLSPTRDGETLVITVRMQSPPAGAILAQVITSPYSMAVVDRADYTTVRFVDQDANLLAERTVP